MSRFELKDSDYSLNASLDPYMILKKMGFTEHSMYIEGEIVRVHCPIHKDLVRKSLIIDTEERTFKCQYANCDAHEGGLLLELVALYYDCDLDEVSKKLFGDEDKSADLLFRGEMFINQGRHLEALPYLEQACDLNPRDEITRCKLSALYLELGRKDDAYREYLNAAESYAVRGELDKTLSIYNILIMLQPGAVKARKELSFLFSRLGRPDAAAEQLKWVVDFYLKYNQIRGAQEACEQIIELAPGTGMSHYLLGKLHKDTNRRIQAVQAFEEACRRFLAAEEYNKAISVLEEAMQLAPSNGRLLELKEQVDEAIAKLPPEELQPANLSPDITRNDEEEFIEWLNGMDEKLAAGEEYVAPENIELDENGLPVLHGEDAPESSEDPIPTATPQEPTSGERPLENKTETTEIAPEDRRVAMCLRDMEELDPDQLEAMRQQLVGMFTDVRKSYEEGNLTDWEMRTIKEFYKSFCVAVDVHRRTDETE